MYELAPLTVSRKQSSLRQAAQIVESSTRTGCKCILRMRESVFWYAKKTWEANVFVELHSKAVEAPHNGRHAEALDHRSHPCDASSHVLESFLATQVAGVMILKLAVLFPQSCNFLYADTHVRRGT